MLDKLVCSHCIRLKISPMHFFAKLSGWHDLDI